MKIVKLILKLLGIALLLAIVALGAKFYLSPMRIIPYPYYFTEKSDSKLEKERQMAEKAKVLILGDRMGLELNKNLKDLETRAQESLKTNLTFFNWSEENESLARTINKLKGLKKIPSLIIYHGGSREFFEKKFHLQDRATILSNFKNYDSDRILSLLITFPELSRIIYLNDTQVPLPLNPIKDPTVYAEGEKILAKDLTYKLFQYEMREFLELLKTNNSTLILITPPINYEIAPNEVCQEVSTNAIIEIHQEVNELLKNGDAKGAYALIKELSNEVVGNADTQYLRGITAMKMGDLSEAREALSLAVSFDCKPDRADPVFNEIMKNEGKKTLAFIIDFDLMGKSQIGGEPFFLNNFFPHNLYYEKINDEILITLKKILNIK